MKVLLINPNIASPPVMPIGIRYIAQAVANSGHQVFCLDLCFSEISEMKIKIKRCIQVYQPNVIGVSLRNLDVEDSEKLLNYNLANYNLANYNLANYNLSNYNLTNNSLNKINSDKITNLEAYDITISAIKEETDSQIVLGGAAFTLIPKQFLKRYDNSIGVIGPGENAFTILLNELEKGDEFNIPGVVTNKSKDSDFLNIDNYSTVELPSYSETKIFPYLEKKSEYNIQSKRGCVFNCIHCSYPLIEGKYVRAHDPKAVAKLIKQKKMEGINNFRFVDSVFNNPIDHAISVCDEILNIGDRDIKFTVNCTPALFNEKFAYALKESGCIKVVFGTDTASKKMLKVMKKPFDKNKIANVTAIARDIDLYIEHHLLLGGPGETRETVYETLEYIDDLATPVFIDLGIQIYDNTPLSKMIKFTEVNEKKLIPNIFIEPTIMNEIAEIIIDFCKFRPLFNTFITKYLEHDNHRSC